MQFSITSISRILVAALAAMFLVQGPALAQDSDRGADPWIGSGIRCTASPPQAGPDGVYVLNLWPGGVVYYTFNANVSPAQQQVVYDAFAAISANSNVTFVAHTTEPNWIEYLLDENMCGPGGCCGSSHVGVAGGVQYVRASSCGWGTGLIVHETGHALGMWHEQQRADRDQYVEIVWANVNPGAEGNFGIVNVPTSGLYDFPSTMHYGQYENSVGPAAIRVNAPYRRFWQLRLSEARSQSPWLSTGDNWTLADMYSGPGPGANLPPRTFSLTAPAPNAPVGTAGPAAFTWQSAQSAIDYRLQVDDDVTFQSPVIDVTTISTSYSNSTALSPNTLYFWRVSASNATGTTVCFPLPWQAIYTAAAYPATLYVDDSAPLGGNGTSWAAALRDLKAATETAYASDGLLSEIRVAGGTYKPDQGSGDRALSFVLSTGCAVKGGYAGYGAPDPDARNIALYPTILSGDLLGDDGPNFTNNADNTSNVVTADSADSTGAIDGVTITAGNAIFDFVAGLYGGGGGLFAYLCQPTVSNCLFTRNSASESGGGMNLLEAPAWVNACRFTNNRTTNFAGGGVVLWFAPGVVITNCLFASNTATAGGGGVTFFYSSGNVINCAFAGNTAAGGGAVNARRGSAGVLTNCVLWGDSAPQGPEIRILAVAGEPFSTITVANCDVAGGQAGVFVAPGSTLVWGAGNITPPADPLFINLPGDLHLMCGSPCINAGDNAAVPPGITTDLDGNPRFVGPVDMGAYEVPMPAIPGDITGDCVVDVNDLLAVINAWGACPAPPCPPYCAADVTHDCVVNVNDLLMVINNWG